MLYVHLLFCYNLFDTASSTGRLFALSTITFWPIPIVTPVFVFLTTIASSSYLYCSTYYIPAFHYSSLYASTNQSYKHKVDSKYLSIQHMFIAHYVYQGVCKVLGTQRKQSQPQVHSASIQSVFAAMSEPSPLFWTRRSVKSGQR